ncbi:MAG TPA: RsmE family RNA methyltransferase [Candidatus Dormibacteraeota bacterium]
MPYFYGRAEGGSVTIEGADARHLARSLRARPGELISVIDPGREILMSVRLAAVSADLVSGTVEEERPHRPEPEVPVTMALAMLPASALDEALARCTELGAVAFLLVQAERSVARGARPERWAAICREASLLAGRLRVPEVSGPMPFAEALQASARSLLLDREAAEPLRALAAPATLLVGPEGGWTPTELASAPAAFSLGPRNLRAENAAAAALAIALS